MVQTKKEYRELNELAFGKFLNLFALAANSHIFPSAAENRLPLTKSKRCTRRKCLVVWIEKVVGRKNAMNYLMMRLVSVCEC